MKLIIDTDPGVDDAFAIALAALSDDVDLLGVTTVFGNVPLSATTRNAQRLLALCKRTDVPIAAGAQRPLVHPQPHRARYAHGADGLSGRAGTLPEPARDLEPTGAVGLLATLLAAADEPVTLVPIGPLTNIATLLAAHSELREKIARVVIMGGALAGGNTTAAAEFNIWSDPEAAHRVLAGGEVPCVLVPMDLTYRCAVDEEWLRGLAESGPLGAALHGLTPDYVEYYRHALGWPGLVLHDAVAMAEAVRPGILRTEAYPVEVDCGFGPGRGATLADQRRPELRERVDGERAAVEVEVAVDTDLDELRAFVLDRIAGGGVR
ncbi:pyrimidine-specific ribonucleoside hydrolase [Amycolatopsis arida]|uniref:Pyrimidine-specific ribonucleoside hydrolase n=1 Tax=Amycolatopsis arida TaxID=587909 RepID=A0A1I5P800_9PSEU|nr:nucleoside hydrolase [Amycolatopsis arida]TDX98381.1 pyrimidine-specific ribonucleoside hydrolase [Amycolatopsis arida]SFP29661.1 pyrimidine-specific ribonucleoside hydrolase [Amycolatopsis arida]